MLDTITGLELDAVAALRSGERIIAKGMEWRCADCARVYRKVRQRVVAAKCPDCGSERASYYALLWFQTQGGAVFNTGAVAQMASVMAILRAPSTPSTGGTTQ